MNWIRLPARNSCSTATKASTWSGNKSYAANALNQYIVADNGAMGYDANGNTLTLPNNLGLTYNSLDQLVSANNGTSLAYDPLGRLAYLSGGNGTVRFDYEGQDLISEIDGGGNVLRRYVHADGVDEPLVWYEGASVNDRRWLHSDERGSVIATSNASGTQTSTNRYDSYGVPASGNVGRFQYTGQTWLPELGMYYYKSRMLAPQVGRFNQPDAIGVAGGVNLYRYVGNDPINFRDPSGLIAVQPGDIVVTLCSGSTFAYSENGNFIGCVSSGGFSGGGSGGYSGGNLGFFGGGGGGNFAPPGVGEPLPPPTAATPSNVKRVNCKSEARKIAEFFSRTSVTTGGAALFFGALGAEPVAAIFGGTSLVADAGGALAGAYIYYNEGDSGPLRSSVIGSIAGAAGKYGTKVFGGSVVKSAGGAIVSKAPSATSAEVNGYAAGQAGGSTVANSCP